MSNLVLVNQEVNLLGLNYQSSPMTLEDFTSHMTLKFTFLTSAESYDLYQVYSSVLTLRSQLQTANSQLQTANSQLQTANSQLQTATQEITELNAELEDLTSELDLTRKFRIVASYRHIANRSDIRSLGMMIIKNGMYWVSKGKASAAGRVFKSWMRQEKMFIEDTPYADTERDVCSLYVHDDDTQAMVVQLIHQYPQYFVSLRSLPKEVQESVKDETINSQAQCLKFVKKQYELYRDEVNQSYGLSL